MNAMEQLKLALDDYKKTALISSVSSLAHWDSEVSMPEEASEVRAEQLGAMAAVIHQKKTDKKYIDLIASLDEKKYSDEISKSQVRLLKKDTLKMLSLPEELVSKSAKLRVQAHHNWITAKSEKNFSIVKNDLKKLVEIEKEIVSRWKEDPTLKTIYGHKSDYEVLVDQYEPEFPVNELLTLLDNLSKATKDILPEIIDRTKCSFKENEFTKTEEWQYKQSRFAVEAIGFDFKRGRLDKSVHPFCTNLLSDVRLTIRYNLNDYTDCLGSALHEAGHGMYEQNLPKELRYTPAGDSVSMGVHESQSRFWENMIGRSLPFCKWFGKVADVSAENLYKRSNQVERTFIRTESDEVTYNIHIYIRMLLEQQLLEGKIGVNEISDAWNQKYFELLGLQVNDESLGILQDSHWFGGAFGYFPTYSIGNIFAASLFKKMIKQFPNWEADVENGNFIFIKNFLIENIHNKASISSGYELMNSVIGYKISEHDLVQYFKNKFLSR